MNRNSLAYIAGFIDGDGCIHASKKHRYWSQLAVAVTDPEPIHFIAAYLKKNVKIKMELNSPFKANPRYRTEVKGHQAIPVIKQLLPFLMEKRNQSFDVLKQFDAWENFPYLKHTREEFFAWLAGFSEAEGHFSARESKSRKSKYMNIYYQLTNTNEPLMNCIIYKLRDYGITESIKLNSLKGSTRMCSVTKRIIKRKPIHRIFLKGGDALLLYKEIYPFMKIKRKKDNIMKSFKLLKKRKRKSERLKEVLERLDGNPIT
jgi:hypothetical protein